MSATPIASPHEVLKAAHQLLLKWNVPEERDQLYLEVVDGLDACGKATGWRLPARLRLVGAVLQVARTLESPAKASHMTAVAGECLTNLRRRRTLGNADAFMLLMELLPCLEPRDAQQVEPASVLAAPADIEEELVDAARGISAQLEYSTMEKSLISAVTVKNFTHARNLIDELELLHQFQSSLPGAAPGSITPGQPGDTERHVSARKFDADTPDAAPACDADAVAETQPIIHGGSSQDSIMVPEHTEVEETLAAMIEMGVEGFDSQPPVEGAPEAVDETFEAMMEMGAEGSDSEIEVVPSHVLHELSAESVQFVEERPAVSTAGSVHTPAASSSSAPSGSHLSAPTVSETEQGMPSGSSTSAAAGSHASIPAVSQTERGLWSAPSSVPPSQPACVDVVAHSGTFMQKRKHAVLEEDIETSQQQSRARASASSGQAASSSHSLFDGPVLEQTTSAARPLGHQTQLRLQPATHTLRQTFLDTEIPPASAGPGKRVQWTFEEEQRLIAGCERYGKRWEQIRKKCSLSHRFGTQLRDKWVNLVKSGRVRDI